MLTLAILATLATVGLLIWTIRSSSSRRPPQENERPRLDHRRSPNAENRDPREALALVGDALAATHNPRVLLPIILEVIAGRLPGAFARRQDRGRRRSSASRGA